MVLAAEFGTFMLVKGHVIIDGPKSGQTEAKVSSKIYIGETVITDNDSRAKIIMSDRNVLNILPNTKLKIEKYTNTAALKEVQLNLIVGKVRTNVGEKYDNKDNKFEIRTATAVAGVRGTEFIVGYYPETKVTEVLTIHGQVSFKSLVQKNSEGSAPEVFVNKQEKSEQKDNSAPSKPAKIPKKEFDAINRDTNVSVERQNNKNPIAGKNDPTTGTKDAEPGSDSNVGEVGSEPIKNSNPISTTKPPTFTPPDKTNVRVIIKDTPH